MCKIIISKLQAWLRGTSQPLGLAWIASLPTWSNHSTAQITGIRHLRTLRTSTLPWKKDPLTRARSWLFKLRMQIILWSSYLLRLEKALYPCRRSCRIARVRQTLSNNQSPRGNSSRCTRLLIRRSSLEVIVLRAILEALIGLTPPKVLPCIRYRWMQHRKSITTWRSTYLGRLQPMASICLRMPCRPSM